MGVELNGSRRVPMMVPISLNMLPLNDAPRAFGLGKLVGHRGLPSVPVPHEVCTPWMQLTPQSYLRRDRAIPGRDR